MWSEPLGRVLIEAAMLRKALSWVEQQGGVIDDIVEDEVSGLMVNSVHDYADSIRDGLRL